ncbi:MAG: hypothetical protein Q8922_02905 [Bacteroidota bacterium]|nr:hypothetical protein [Bacteroidota bacterium]MDP4232915.1 hypothetical protein [Bacteroidota bacterium]MDP4241959.1 hypothetical protein [Bacteroidota bacterium]MDP4286862.1 hypothetical protein [Bacteroidota bacterium]
MRKFAPMILPLLTLAVVLAGEDVWVSVAAIVIAAFSLGWNIMVWRKAMKPVVRLVIRNYDNRRFPEMGPPRINILCLRLSFGSEFISFKSTPEFRDDKGRSLRWSPVDPEDWNASFDKDESPVTIHLDYLNLEHDSRTIRAICRFDEKRLVVRTNTIRCEDLLRARADGVSRKKPGEGSVEEEMAAAFGVD